MSLFYSKLSRLLKLIEIFDTNSELLIFFENFWLSRLFEGFKAQSSQQIEKSLPKYAENWLFLYSEWEKLFRLTSIFRSGLIGWSQSKLLGLESWSRENWDFLISINIDQLSRQAFWKRQEIYLVSKLTY